MERVVCPSVMLTRGFSKGRFRVLDATAEPQGARPLLDGRWHISNWLEFENAELEVVGGPGSEPVTNYFVSRHRWPVSWKNIAMSMLGDYGFLFEAFPFSSRLSAEYEENR